MESTLGSDDKLSMQIFLIIMLPNLVPRRKQRWDTGKGV